MGTSEDQSERLATLGVMLRQLADSVQPDGSRQPVYEAELLQRFEAFTVSDDDRRNGA